MAAAALLVTVPAVAEAEVNTARLLISRPPLRTQSPSRSGRVALVRPLPALLAVTAATPFLTPRHLLRLAEAAVLLPTPPSGRVAREEPVLAATPTVATAACRTVRVAEGAAALVALVMLGLMAVPLIAVPSPMAALVAAALGHLEQTVPTVRRFLLALARMVVKVEVALEPELAARRHQARAVMLQRHLEPGEVVAAAALLVPVPEVVLELLELNLMPPTVLAAAVAAVVAVLTMLPPMVAPARSMAVAARVEALAIPL